MKYCWLFILFVIFSCNQQNNSDTAKSGSVTVINDTISLVRDEVGTGPVASFIEKVEDPLNDWKFAVEVYETKATFDFLIKMQYKELEAEDTLNVPNFGIMPKVEIRKGTEKESCIIGFLDKQGESKDYKLVQIKNNQLKISTLRHYARTRYKVK
ncbi:hypothetical protein [Dyadobacter bucti]|uniref:hypothetical protein n=1 Tax=Dyadobacter bucti TaxID=2572203 RepID=UPI001108D10B|nr:hypothetical protein [Dyadobacter bucti]